MNRVVFTKNICWFILEMVEAGELVLLDYGKRSDEEQFRLYTMGLSKCDGKNIISMHQRGRAVDLYTLKPDLSEICDPNLGWDYWHHIWQTKYGGEPMISWDQGHFEGALTKGEVMFQLPKDSVSGFWRVFIWMKNVFPFYFWTILIIGLMVLLLAALGVVYLIS